jgi:hypothetical protein
LAIPKAAPQEKISIPKKKRPEEKPEEQFKRFVQAAKERGVDDKAAKDVERSFSRIAKSSGASSKT